MIPICSEFDRPQLISMYDYEGAKIEDDCAQTNRKQKFRNTICFKWKTMGVHELQETNHYSKRNTTRSFKETTSGSPLTVESQLGLQLSHSLTCSSYKEQLHIVTFTKTMILIY